MAVRIGITGHMNLATATVPLIMDALRSALTPYAKSDLVGVSCIAVGADQLFASVVLEMGGVLEVFLPSRKYREQVIKPDNLAVFDDLITRATKVRYMPFENASRNAYEAANEAVLRSVERLLAVWDGQPSGGKSGTGDVVAHARSLGLPVEVIWPDGAGRT